MATRLLHVLSRQQRSKNYEEHVCRNTNVGKRRGKNKADSRSAEQISLPLSHNHIGRPGEVKSKQIHTYSPRIHIPAWTSTSSHILCMLLHIIASINTGTHHCLVDKDLVCEL